VAPVTSGLSIVFAHGAGAPSGHPWMQGWKARLATAGAVHTFDYDYMVRAAEAGRRKPPDRLPKLLVRHRRAVDEALAADAGPLVLAGKSMGSRVGCHLAAEEERVAAVICFGYPLVSISGKLRDEALLALRCPTLLVQGDRDRLCPLDALEPVVARMQAPVTLHVVAGGDHSLALRKRDLKAAGRTQDDVDEQTARAVLRWLEGLALDPS